MVFGHQYDRPVQHLFLCDLNLFRWCLQGLLTKYDIGRGNYFRFVLVLSFRQILWCRYLNMLDGCSIFLLFVDYHDVWGLREYQVWWVVGHGLMMKVNVGFLRSSLSILV